MTTGRIATRKQETGASEDRMTDTEEFYPVKDYPNYLLSTDGRLYSKRLKRLMKLEMSRNGYQRVFLYNEKGFKKLLLHRLVALNFLPNPNNLKEVNHIDGNKLNNSLSNLEWCSTKFNHKHAEVNGLKAKGDTHGMTKLSHSQRREIRAKYIPREYSSGKLAKEYGVTPQAIRYTLKNS